MILAFAHPALVVPDLEAAREFYEAMFGFRVISTEGWHNAPDIDRVVGSSNSSCTGYMMAGHNCCLELFTFESPQQEGPPPVSLGSHEMGIRHLAFYVDDCRQEYERLLSLGGQVLGEPVAIAPDVYAAYCRDPFGNIIELCEIPVPEEEPTRLPGINCLGTHTG